MPILGLLGLLFIGLKLGHVIAWSWLLVLAPFWAIPVLLVATILFAGTGIGVIALFSARRQRDRRIKSARL